MSKSSWNEIREHEGRIKQMQYVRGLEEQVAALTKERNATNVTLRAIEAMLGTVDHAPAIEDPTALPDFITTKLAGILDRLRAEQRIPPGFTAERLEEIVAIYKRSFLDCTNKQLLEWAAWLREQPKQQEQPIAVLERIAPQESGTK